MLTLKLSGLMTLGVLSASLAASPVSAAVTNISSSSSVLDISLTVAGIPIAIGPLLLAAGSAPPAYDVTKSLASLDLPALGLRTGLLTDTASSPYPPTATGTATSTVDDLVFAPLASLLFRLTATAISSTSSVDGSPSATGSTTIDHLRLKLPGLPVITFSGTPTVNDVLFSAGGLTVTLNEQVPDTTETKGITTDAIAISFDNFLVGTNLVNGSVDIAESAASINISSIPEPATWLEMLAGFGAVGFLMRGRRQAKAAALS